MLTTIFENDQIIVIENGSGEIIIRNKVLSGSAGIRIIPAVKNNYDLIVTAFGGSALVLTTYHAMPAIKVV